MAVSCIIFTIFLLEAQGSFLDLYLYVDSVVGFACVFLLSVQQHGSIHKNRNILDVHVHVGILDSPQ